MDKQLARLAPCSLFKQMEEIEVGQLFDGISWRVRHYQRGELLVTEGADCSTLGIVLQGKVEVKKIFASGKTVVLTQLEAGEIFGEAIIFSSLPQYPATIEAVTHASVVLISRVTVERWCQMNPRFLANFMGLLSDKLLLLNQKVKMLSLGRIRQKICSVLLELSRRQNSGTVQLPWSRRMMAEHLGVPRPSLSRELALMQEQHWITVQRNMVVLHDVAVLEQELYR